MVSKRDQLKGGLGTGKKKPLQVAPADEARFVGSTTTNGEIQDPTDRRVYHRKSRGALEARSVRKMSIYVDAELADRLDIAKVRLKARDRSELIERAIAEFLDREGH